MQLTAQDKKAAREGFAYVVIRGGKRVCYASTLGEAKRECGKTGRVVSISGMRYAAQNPFRGSLNVRNPSEVAAPSRLWKKSKSKVPHFTSITEDGELTYHLTSKDGVTWEAIIEPYYGKEWSLEKGSFAKVAKAAEKDLRAYNKSVVGSAISFENPSLNVRNPSAARKQWYYLTDGYHHVAIGKFSSQSEAIKKANIVAAANYPEYRGMMVVSRKMLENLDYVKSAMENPSINVRNPSSGAKQRARGTRSYGKGLFVEADLSGRHARMLDKAAGVRRKSAKLGPTYTKLMHREALAEAARVRNPSAAEVGHSVGKYGKYAARGAGRAAKSAWQGTKSFFGSAYASFKKHNPSKQPVVVYEYQDGQLRTAQIIGHASDSASAKQIAKSAGFAAPSVKHGTFGWGDNNVNTGYLIYVKRRNPSLNVR